MYSAKKFVKELAELIEYREISKAKEELERTNYKLSDTLDIVPINKFIPMIKKMIIDDYDELDIYEVCETCSKCDSEDILRYKEKRYTISGLKTIYKSRGSYDLYIELHKPDSIKRCVCNRTPVKCGEDCELKNFVKYKNIGNAIIDEYYDKKEEVNKKIKSDIISNVLNIETIIYRLNKQK